MIIDMHQDLYGVGFGGNGVFYWVCDESLYESYELTEPWFVNYFTPEVQACFDVFWCDPDL